MKKKKGPNHERYIKENNFYTWFWLFIMGSVAGIILEGICAFVQYGRWEYHTGTIWGPFCLIYGIGAVIVYTLSQMLQNVPLVMEFIAYTIAGALVEYFGSFFQEVCFGTISWNYSDHFLNIGGRVSLIMALVWGVLSFLFVYVIFPPIKKLLYKLNGKLGFIVTWVLIVFMIINVTATILTLNRWNERTNGIAASGSVDEMIDRYYNNKKMEQLFPNMRFVPK